MTEGLDILVAAPAAAARLAECLAALERELATLDETDPPVTLPVACAGDPLPDVSQRWPHARWLACDVATSLPALYGRALDQTTSAWLAFLDADCHPSLR